MVKQGEISKIVKKPLERPKRSKANLHMSKFMNKNS